MLVDRLIEKGHLQEREAYNSQLLSRTGTSGEPSLVSGNSGERGETHARWSTAASELIGSPTESSAASTATVTGKELHGPVELGTESRVYEMSG